MEINTLTIKGRNKEQKKKMCLKGMTCTFNSKQMGNIGRTKRSNYNMNRGPKKCISK
jgi:hypothetical protein